MKNTKRKLTDDEKRKLNALLSRVELCTMEEHEFNKRPVILPFMEGVSLALFRAQMRQGELAKELGVSGTRVSKWIAGVYNPNYKDYMTIIQLCAKWNVKLMEVK